MKVLITVPHAEVAGGVANYYRIFRKHGSKRFEFIIIGNQGRERSLCRTLIRFLTDIRCFIKTIISNPYDLIILNPSLDPKSLVRDGMHLFLAKLFGKKVVVFFRGWHTKWEPLIFDKLGWFFRFCFFKANAMITLAVEFKKKLENIGYSKPIFLETTIVDDDAFSDFRRKKYKLSPERFDSGIHILFLSRIQREKGIYETIKAFQVLKRRHPTVSLSIAGDGKELDRVIQYIDRSHIESIEILGYIDGREKTEAFQKADIYLFPTYYGEGMPNSVLEAMAYGLPVITRPVGGIKDFFEDGKMGCLSNSLSPKVIASNIERLIVNPNLVNKIGKYNHEYAKQHFGSSQVIQRIELICELVFKGKKDEAGA
ncbi:MAG: hypothetical protein BA873_10395 [Desulfobulbaceae bacterium C00003063]|nr:MAG: hypothetical protein BA873_10395 [Desulfobulbaceae bacterium C00003063]